MKEFIRNQLRIAHFIFVALLLGQGLFFLFAYFITAGRNQFFNEQFSNHPLYIAVPILTFGAIIGAFFIERNRRKKIPKITSLERKLSHFRETMLLQAVLVEGANIFAILVSILSFSYYPYLFFSLGLLFFLWYYPSEDRFYKLYNP